VNNPLDSQKMITMFLAEFFMSITNFGLGEFRLSVYGLSYHCQDLRDSNRI
jgi:hypothetical protein